MRQLQSTTPLRLTWSDASYKYCNKHFTALFIIQKNLQEMQLRKICTFSKIRKKKMRDAILIPTHETTLEATIKR